MTSAADDELLRLADQCVKCGYCLPHCPTFRSERHEADSPRGRIALIQGWVGGELPLSRALVAHLDGCLGCRACEQVCPSRVEYGRLADAARARRWAARPRLIRAWHGARLDRLADARWNGWLARLARYWVDWGFDRLFSRLPWGEDSRLAAYRRIGAELGRRWQPPRRLPDQRPAPDRATAALFVGCLGVAAQGCAVEAALHLLQALGQPVRLTRTPQCCGALHRHHGLPEQADRRRAAVVREAGGQPLIGLSSACVAELREAPELADTAELCAWLEQLPWPAPAPLRPLPRRVAVHEPCSHRHRLGGNRAVHALLRRIPELEVVSLTSQPLCCGSAGTQMLETPGQAQRLARETLAPLADRPADYLVTTNIGCALHLAATARAAGLVTEVCHPVELLARQWAMPATTARADDDRQTR